MHPAIGMLIVTIGLILIHFIHCMTKDIFGEHELTPYEEYTKKRDKLMYDSLHLKLERRDEFFEILKKFSEDYKENANCIADSLYINSLANRTIRNNFEKGIIPILDYQLN